MLRGVGIFQERYAAHADQHVLIGGIAIPQSPSFPVSETR